MSTELFSRLAQPGIIFGIYPKNAISILPFFGTKTNYAGKCDYKKGLLFLGANSTKKTVSWKSGVEMTASLDFIMNANMARASELLKFGLFEECRVLCQENIGHFQKIAEPSSLQIATVAESMAMRGECAFLSGDYSGARANYQRATHLAPRESAYWQRLAQSSARLFENTGDALFASESAGAAKNVSLLQRRDSETFRSGKANCDIRDHRVCC